MKFLKLSFFLMFKSGLIFNHTKRRKMVISEQSLRVPKAAYTNYVFITLHLGFGSTFYLLLEVLKWAEFVSANLKICQFFNITRWRKTWSNYISPQCFQSETRASSLSRVEITHLRTIVVVFYLWKQTNSYRRQKNAISAISFADADYTQHS